MCSVRLYLIFPHYLINGTIYGGGGVLLNIKCVLNSPRISVILRRIQRDVVINVYWSSCKVQVISFRF